MLSDDGRGKEDPVKDFLSIEKNEIPILKFSILFHQEAYCTVYAVYIYNIVQCT